MRNRRLLSCSETVETVLTSICTVKQTLGYVKVDDRYTHTEVRFSQIQLIGKRMLFTMNTELDNLYYSHCS